jgi:hypothetical protein
MPTSGEALDLGELEFTKGLSIAGRLAAAAGEELPSGVRLILGRDPAWDLIEMTADAEGKFSIEGLPPESYEIQIIAKGYEVDESRLELQRLDLSSIGLRLDESQSDVVVPLVRATSPDPEQSDPNVNLDGGNQTLAGIVVDPQGRPVAGATVSAQLAYSYQPLSFRPGRSQPWMDTDAAGRFEISDLPDAPIQLMVYRRSPKGGRIVFPAKAWPSMNASDLRIIYDPELQH